MKTSREAFGQLQRAVNLKYYIGVNGAKLIEDACCALTEEEKGRPPSYVAPKEELPTEDEVDEALFEEPISPPSLTPPSL